MDLGIRGRTAIVCASSHGLGKGCALALAAAGVAVVINGRTESALAETAEEIRRATGSDVTPVVADVSTAEGQAAVEKTDGRVTLGQAHAFRCQGDDIG